MNKVIFNKPGTRVPETDTKNDAGGKAYKMSPKETLAKLATTGSFYGTFYATGQIEFSRLVQALEDVNDPSFIKQTAIYARHEGFLKDMPVAIVTWLFSKSKESNDYKEAFYEAFTKVVTNFKMVSKFIQVVRSGVLGRTSLGSLGTHLINKFIAGQSVYSLLRATAGNKPSLIDIVNLTHYKPVNEEHRKFFNWLMTKETSDLPKEVEELLLYRDNPDEAPVPNSDFRLLTNHLDEKGWLEVARRAKHMQARMSLVTFANQGLFGKGNGIEEHLVKVLSDKEQIVGGMQMPTDYFKAYSTVSTNDNVPISLKNALIDALETSFDNVPTIPGRTVVCVDTSGSMGSYLFKDGHSYYSGNDSNLSGTVQAAASVIAAGILKKNQDTKVILFDTQAHKEQLNGRDSITTIADNISKYNGGGTDMSCAFDEINKLTNKVNNIIFLSDSECWRSMWSSRSYYSKGTPLMESYVEYKKKKNSKAKLVLIDLAPGITTQAKPANNKDVLNVSGFTPAIFNSISKFLSTSNSNEFIKTIENYSI